MDDVAASLIADVASLADSDREIIRRAGALSARADSPSDLIDLVLAPPSDESGATYRDFSPDTIVQFSSLVGAVWVATRQLMRLCREFAERSSNTAEVDPAEAVAAELRHAGLTEAQAEAVAPKLVDAARKQVGAA